MDKATQSMIENLHRNTGKTLGEWMQLAQQQGFAKHGEMIKFLKEQHGLTHGFANLIAHKARGSDAGSAENKDALIEAQYKGKEHFRPLYEALLAQILDFGPDVEVAPKKSYVSLRRKKQFALLQPVTKNRFEIGLNLKGQEGGGLLEASTAANAMCSHKISLASPEAVDEEVMRWLREAYEQAG